MDLRLDLWESFFKWLLPLRIWLAKWPDGSVAADLVQRKSLGSTRKVTCPVSLTVKTGADF